jgi:hypothetical protein
MASLIEQKGAMIEGFETEINLQASLMDFLGGEDAL